MGFTPFTDKATGKEVLVDADHVSEALANPNLAPPTAIAVHRNGQDTYAPADVARNDAPFAPAIDPSTASTALAHAERKQENTGVLAGAKSFTGGLVDSLSMGALSPFQNEREFNSGLSTVGSIAGVVGPLLVGDLGGLAGGARAVVDPLEAERAASGISTGFALTGSPATALERSLGRAKTVMGDADAARSALSAEGIAGMDMPALKAARVQSEAQHAVAIADETKSLESLRVEQRAEAANEVQDLHEQLHSETPIYQAVNGEDVESIQGVKSIQVKMAKSNSALLGLFDKPITIQRDPWKLIEPLETRQAALELLQPKVPELMAALGDDSRAAGLAHVDDALEQTKAQIAKIKSLSGREQTPLTSGRLVDLKSGGSQTTKAIDTAMDTLKNAPEAGTFQKMAQGAAFGAGTALAHMIPGVGIAAPLFGAGASKLVGRVFEHLAEHGASMAGKTSEAIGSLTSGIASAAKGRPALASAVLAGTKFGAGPDAKSNSIDDQYARVSHELRSQTMYAPDGSVQIRPEARQGIAQRLGPIGAVNPVLADKIETNKARIVSYLSGLLPRLPEVGGIRTGPSNAKPSDLAIRSFAMSCHAAENPTSVLDMLAKGSMTPEAADAFRNCYPEWFAHVQQQVTLAAPQMAKAMPFKQRMAWSVFAGTPIDASMMPNIKAVLQRSFTAPAPDANTSIPGMEPPKMKPSFGSLGSIKKSIPQPTPAQSRANAGSNR